MPNIPGLNKQDSILLREIEHFAKTGDRLDGLQVTDEWVDQAVQFLTRELRPTLEAWHEIGKILDRESAIVRSAKRLHKAWKKGARGSSLDKHFRDLEGYLAPKR